MHELKAEKGNFPRQKLMALNSARSAPEKFEECAVCLNASYRILHFIIVNDNKLFWNSQLGGTNDKFYIFKYNLK